MRVVTAHRHRGYTVVKASLRTWIIAVIVTATALAWVVATPFGQPRDPDTGNTIYYTDPMPVVLQFTGTVTRVEWVQTIDPPPMVQYTIQVDDTLVGPELPTIVRATQTEMPPWHRPRFRIEKGHAVTGKRYRFSSEFPYSPGIPIDLWPSRYGAQPLP
jgi:hypothetical protein